MDQDKEYIASLLRSASNEEKNSLVVNAPFKTMLPLRYDIGTIVFLIDNKQTGFIERIALSNTSAANGAVRASALPFKDILIPRGDTKSAHVKALKNKKAVVLSHWYDMFRPALTKEQARDNQLSSGISTSVVQPFYGSTTQGTIIFSFYTDVENITREVYDFMDWYSSLVSEIY